MRKIKTDVVPTEPILFAPEGFLDERYVPLLKMKDLCIIELHNWADGPVFRTVHHKAPDSELSS